MKKTLLVVPAFMIASLVCPSVKAALIVSTTTSMTESLSTIDSAKEILLLARVNEIRAINKSSLNLSQKRGLRKELGSIKKQLKDMGGRGVYISVGALIIIILLLILIL